VVALQERLQLRLLDNALVFVPGMRFFLDRPIERFMMDNV
jgi:hypothetical protein